MDEQVAPRSRPGVHAGRCACPDPGGPGTAGRARGARRCRSGAVGGSRRRHDHLPVRHLPSARRPDWFNDEVQTAFDGSTRWCSRRSFPTIRPRSCRSCCAMRSTPQGRKLSDRLTPEHNAALNAAVFGSASPPVAFDSHEPWFVSMWLSAVAAQQFGLNAAHGAETVLIRAARARSIPVAELEGLEWQIRMFDGMPEEQQLAHLASRSRISEVGRSSRRCSPPGRPAMSRRCRISWPTRASRIRACTDSSSPIATRPGPAGSRSGWRGRARCSSPSARRIWPDGQRPGRAPVAGHRRRARAACRERSGARFLTCPESIPPLVPGAEHYLASEAGLPYRRPLPRPWSSLEAWRGCLEPQSGDMQ